jgi:hypothetical protein
MPNHAGCITADACRLYPSPASQRGIIELIDQWMEHPVASATSDEQSLQFLLTIRALARCPLTADDRLEAIDEAITRALSGSIADATAWAGSFPGVKTG